MAPTNLNYKMNKRFLCVGGKLDDQYEKKKVLPVKKYDNISGIKKVFSRRRTSSSNTKIVNEANSILFNWNSSSSRLKNKFNKLLLRLSDLTRILYLFSWDLWDTFDLYTYSYQSNFFVFMAAYKIFDDSNCRFIVWRRRVCVIKRFPIHFCISYMNTDLYKLNT